MNIDFDKMKNLVPAIIQDVDTLQVLMLGYMDKDAFQNTVETKKVTFLSRSKQRLWTKGETTGYVLDVIEIIQDCDRDALLIKVKPQGPCCHLMTVSCFGKEDAPGIGFLSSLAKIIDERYQKRPENSYTVKLFSEGTQRIAQKVGEEGLEVALAAVGQSDHELTHEVSDLIYHVFVLLKQRGINFLEVVQVLHERCQEAS